MRLRQGADLAWLYENGEVLERRTGETGDMSVTVRLTPEKLGIAELRLAAQIRRTDSDSAIRDEFARAAS